MVGKVIRVWEHDIVPRKLEKLVETISRSADRGARVIHEVRTLADSLFQLESRFSIIDAVLIDRRRSWSL